jgi:two-component system chemotaxis response regulator CheB
MQVVALPGQEWCDGVKAVGRWKDVMRRDVIVIGASAGGVEALRDLVAHLPADLPAAVLVVLHVPSYGGSVLPSILSRSGPLPARHPVGGDPLTHGEILVAPPDHHLVVDGETVRVTRGPRENGHRPAVDVLFRSAARAAGVRVIGVVLSGTLDDGTAGLAAVVGQGGLAIAQDPQDALYPGMPESAMANVPVDHVAPAEEIAKLLVRLTDEEFEAAPRPEPELLRVETDLAMMEDHAMNEPDRPGHPSGFSCPDCSGVLYEIRDGILTRYRCRVGHAWSAESLFGEQNQQLEGALWMALRGLEEKAALARKLADQARERGNSLSAAQFAQHDEEASRAASLIRQMLEVRVGFASEMDVGTGEQETG